MGRLTALKVKSLVEPGRYGDGDGLWLQVRDATHRSWLLRYTRHGKARQMGLGPYPHLGLAEARDAAVAARQQIKAGIDPIAERQRKAQADLVAVQVTTFQAVAEMLIASHEATWRHEKHRHQWRSSLLTYAFPVLGKMPVREISTGDVMKVIEPLWHEKAETASRLRGRIEAVLDYAAARGWRVGDNPARWRGHLANLLPKRSKVSEVRHHPALPWAEIGAFMAALRAEAGQAARALEFIILTASRTNEVLGARWSEIDLAERSWTIPASRMKAGREHRVPLTDAALTLIRALPPPPADVGDSHVFAAARPGRGLSSMAALMLLRRMKRSDLTAHGFRSTFRDWAAERTNFPREIAEAALAHTLRDKSEAAYRRSDLFEKRAKLMEAWGQFCGKTPAVGDVLPLRRPA